MGTKESEVAIPTNFRELSVFRPHDAWNHFSLDSLLAPGPQSCSKSSPRRAAPTTGCSIPLRRKTRFTPTLMTNPPFSQGHTMNIRRSLLAVVLLSTSFASAQVFTITDLGPGVIPAGVNERGEVAAMRGGAPGGSLWTEEAGFTDLDPLPGFPLTLRGESITGVTWLAIQRKKRAPVFTRLCGHIQLGQRSTLDRRSSATPAPTPLMTHARQREIWAILAQSFVWTRRAGMVDIGPPPAGILFYEASAISEDGTRSGPWATTLPELHFSGPGRQV